MLHSKHCHVDSQPPSTRSTPRHGTNGSNSVNGCASQPTFKVSGTPSLSSVSLPSVCTLVLCWTVEHQSINGPWNSNFVPLGKYSHPWGPATLNTTSWEISTFTWANISQLTQSRTLRLPNSTQYLSPSFKPLTAPVKGGCSTNNPSATCHVLISSFSSVQASTAWAAPTPTAALSSYNTPSTSLAISPSAHPL